MHGVSNRKGTYWSHRVFGDSCPAESDKRDQEKKDSTNVNKREVIEQEESPPWEDGHLNS